jgi:hypothetical protein
MILKIFSPKNLAKILAFFAQTTLIFCKNLIITLVFEQKRQFFRRKIAENCDHNIDPWKTGHFFCRRLCLRKMEIASKTLDGDFLTAYHPCSPPEIKVGLKVNFVLKLGRFHNG